MWAIFWPGYVKASVASYSFIAQMLVSAPPSVAELRVQTKAFLGPNVPLTLSFHSCLVTSTTFLFLFFPLEPEARLGISERIVLSKPTGRVICKAPVGIGGFARSVQEKTGRTES